MPSGTASKIKFGSGLVVTDEGSGVIRADVDQSVVTDTIFDTKGDIIVGTGADAASKLPVGSNGQILTADSAQPTGIKWAPAPGGGVIAVDTIWDAKGDLAVGTGADAAAKLAVGSDNQILTADSAQASGLKWATPSAAGSVATDPIFDAKGDIPVGTGADVASKLPVGSNNQVLTADSAQTSGVKWATPSAYSSVATDSIFDAKGDILVGTGPDAASRLPVGVNGKLLIADSAAANGVKWGDPSLASGGTWRVTAAAPALAEGIEGDWHYDSLTGYVYRKRIIPPIPVVRAYSQGEWNSAIATVNYPAGSVAGDLIVLGLTAYNANITVPSGWILEGSENLGLGHWWHVIRAFRGSETSKNIDFSTNVGGLWRCWALRSDSVHPTNPVRAFDSMLPSPPSNQMVIPAPSIIMPTDGLVLRAWAISQNLTSGGYTLPAGDVQDGVYYWSANTQSSIASHKQESAGTVPTRNLTLTASANNTSGASIGVVADTSSAPLDWVLVGRFQRVVNDPIHVQRTTDLVISGSSSSAPTSVVDSGAATYEAVVTRFEFNAPNVQLSGTWTILVGLYDGTTIVRRIAALAGSGTAALPLHVVHYLTPSVGSHTYAVKAWITGGSATLSSGATDGDQYMPTYLRITPGG